MFSSTKSRNAGKTLLQTLFFILLVTHICLAQWYQQTSGTDLPLRAVSFTDASNGTAVGGRILLPEGTVLRTKDREQNWIGRINGTTNSDNAIILKTTDGGQNWMSQASGTVVCFFGVSFIDANIGWAVGYKTFLSSMIGTIIHTTDGGTSWPEQYSLTDTLLSSVLLSVFFTDENNGTVVGSGGTILRTTNGGTTWSQQISGTTNHLYSVCFTDANTGTVVGGGGTILRTTNSGTAWTSQTSGTNAELSGVSFTDTNNGTAVGAGAVIIRTTDGGQNWVIQSSGKTSWLRGVSFSDVNNGMAVGDYGTILRTTDGGQNWVIQSSGLTDEGLFGISFKDANNGTAVGENGVILHTTNGGLTFVEEKEIDEMPTEFLLSQNYPNPFNPSTKIKYSIPNVIANEVKQTQFITLKVYDILGNEIETLVNEEKTAGTYEVTWYVEQLPSGVYFYQLKAGEYTSVKKMVLLK